jgi:hypothetical protein
VLEGVLEIGKQSRLVDEFRGLEFRKRGRSSAPRMSPRSGVTSNSKSDRSRFYSVQKLHMTSRSRLIDTSSRRRLAENVTGRRDGRQHGGEFAPISHRPRTG